MDTTAPLQHSSMRGYKIRLESPKFTKKLRLIYQLFVFTSGVSAISIFYVTGFNVIIGLLSALSFGFISLAVHRIFKGIVTGSIHGDYLIVTHRLTNKSKVVDIKHLKSIRSRSFLGIPATQFIYNLDGDIRKVVILGGQEKNLDITHLLQSIKKAA